MSIKNTLLSSYYKSPSKSSSRSVNNDPDSIDSVVYDCNRAFKGMLQTEGIDGLLRRDSDLRKEIKNLDSQMKTLVHNNYKNFITAADTINQMNKNIEGMEARMRRLQEKTENVEKCSKSVSEHLLPKQSQVEQLSGVYQLLQQLQFLAAVPAHLEASLKSGNFADGIEYYLKTAVILEKYSHVQSFHLIKVNAEKLLEVVKEAVLERFDDTELSLQQLQQYYFLLKATNEQDDTLRSRFYEKRYQKMHHILEKWKNFSINPATPDEPKTTSYRRFVSNLHADFFPPFTSFIIVYQSLFIPRGRRSTEDEDISSATEELDSNVETIFREYTDTVSYHLIKSESPEAMIACLDLIGIEFREAHKEYSVPKTDLATRATGVIAVITNNLINNYYETFINDFNTAISKMGAQLEEDEAKSDPPSDYFEDVVLKTEATIINALEQLFEKITPMVAEMVGPYPQLPSYVLSCMAEAMADINEQGLNIRVMDSLPSKSFILSMSRVWQRFERTSIPTFERRFRELVERVGLGANFKGPKLDTCLREIKEGVMDTARHSLAYFVLCEGEKLSSMIRKAFEASNWLDRREPRDVEMVIDWLLKEIIQQRVYLVRVFPPTTNEGASAVVATQGKRGKNLVDILQGFSFFEKLELERGSILSAIIKVCLKTFLECVRLVTFNTHGYQQIQVNITYMKLALTQNNLIDDKVQLPRMLEEIIINAEERTIDPVPMEALIVERICNEKLKKL